MVADEIKTLLDALPHGSGINGKWDFDFTIYAYNSYEIMDGETGMYTGSVSFALIIPAGEPEKFRLEVENSALAREYGIEEYLEDLFADALS